MLFINPETHSYTSYISCYSVDLNADTNTLTFFDEEAEEIFQDHYTDLSDALKELLAIKERSPEIHITLSFADDRIFDLDSVKEY